MSGKGNRRASARMSLAAPGLCGALIASFRLLASVRFAARSITKVRPSVYLRAENNFDRFFSPPQTSTQSGGAANKRPHELHAGAQSGRRADAVEVDRPRGEKDKR